MIVLTCLYWLVHWVALLGSGIMASVRIYVFFNGYAAEQELSIIAGGVISLAAFIALGIDMITVGF